MTMNKLLGGRELSRFSKNSCEEVRLILHNFGCGKYIDVRVWAKIRPSDGTASTPTERGFELAVELLPDLKRAIDQVQTALGGDAVTETKV
jgi:hypothetical protein